ncbi:MAG TPA: PTS sugar transporter subunit IIA [bacterium]|nr:PTS sugar transporter subunit IIA [bacterium]
MVGIVVVAHGGLSDELIRTTSMIIEDEMISVHSVPITGLEDPDDIKHRIQNAIKQANDGDGVLILTDMFGGTPSNIALSFLQEDHVDVISGVNLPMLVDLVYSREGKTLAELAAQLAETGKNNILLASQYLRGNQRT